MSRALDKATVAALQSGDPEAAYQAIADVLTGAPSPSLSSSSSSSSSSARLELEFLGREHLPLPEASPYYLRDGNAVAIPKVALLLAFVVARRRLQQQLSSAAGSASSHSHSHSHSPASEREKLRATAVILMMDAEHLTAANVRKRILQERLRSSRDAASAASVVAGELWLIDSFLTGHLHRHTKSPTLWNHRRWLLAFASAQNTGPVPVPVTVPVDPLRDITEVVMVAAERHPRNYYAWDHARWLVQHGGEQTDTLTRAVRDWCYRHHTDTSGWSLLLFLLTPGAGEARAVSPLLAETVAQVEQMAASLRWMGEAVWVFLRTAVAYTVMATGDQAEAAAAPRLQFLETAARLQLQAGPGSREHQVLQRAQDWCIAKIKSE